MQVRVMEEVWVGISKWEGVGVDTVEGVGVGEENCEGRIVSSPAPRS